MMDTHEDKAWGPCNDELLMVSIHFFLRTWVIHALSLQFQMQCLNNRLFTPPFSKYLCETMNKQTKTMTTWRLEDSMFHIETISVWVQLLAAPRYSALHFARAIHHFADPLLNSFKTEKHCHWLIKLRSPIWTQGNHRESLWATNQPKHATKVEKTTNTWGSTDFCD